MALPEGLRLIHRSEVSDEAMTEYRRVMAPCWFAGDIIGQNDYINSPSKAPAYVTQNLCLLKGSQVKGTISLYSFRNPYPTSICTIERSSFDLNSLPTWLTSIGYLGDNSVTPDLEGQGIMQSLVSEMIKKFPQAYLIGITKDLNLGMQAVFHKTGATTYSTNHKLKPGFYQPKEPRTISLRLNTSRLTHTPLYVNTNYPPVIHLFHNTDNTLVCGAIGTTPNNPGTAHAKYVNKQNSLFPNQVIGFINPETELNSSELDTIYSQLARYKYLNLFQLPTHTQ